MQEKSGGTRPIYLESLLAKVSGWGDPEARLREAFAGDEFLLLGQSIVPLAASKQMPFRLELLVRLLEEEVNLTPPGAFFPALEACGMMSTLDCWVVARAAAWWRERNGVANTVLHVNLSPETLDDADFAEFVQAQLRDSKMPPAGFAFELPATEIAAGSPSFLASVEKLKAAGCGLVVTGFGRDSVSLDALRVTGAPVVKIDGSMVRTVSDDPDAYSRVRSIHRLCSTAGVITIAEFVERPETVTKLREIGVGYMQGYGIAKPEPLAASAAPQTAAPRTTALELAKQLASNRPQARAA